MFLSLQEDAMGLLDQIEGAMLRARWIDAIPEAIAAAISGPMGCSVPQTTGFSGQSPILPPRPPVVPEPLRQNADISTYVPPERLSQLQDECNDASKAFFASRRSPEFRKTGRVNDMAGRTLCIWACSGSLHPQEITSCITKSIERRSDTIDHCCEQR